MEQPYVDGSLIRIVSHVSLKLLLPEDAAWILGSAPDLETHVWVGGVGETGRNRNRAVGSIRRSLTHAGTSRR
jgi:hypothetical protein